VVPFCEKRIRIRQGGCGDGLGFVSKKMFKSEKTRGGKKNVATLVKKSA